MDEEGNKYNLYRQYDAGNSTSVMASLEVPGLDSMAKPAFDQKKMYKGRIYHEMDKEKGFILVKPDLGAQESFSVTITTKDVHWKDANGRIDVKFTAPAQHLHFVCPGKLEDAGYRSLQCVVEGTVDGKKVIGWGNLDTGYGPPGVVFTQGKIYNLLEEQWCVFLNIYEDGSKEGGIFINGVDQFRVGYYYKDSKSWASRNCSFDVEYTEDNFIKGATMKMDELSFKFTTESRIMQLPVKLAWASGNVKKLDESRTPVKSFAWFEFFPKQMK